MAVKLTLTQAPTHDVIYHMKFHRTIQLIMFLFSGLVGSYLDWDQLYSKLRVLNVKS